MKNEEVDVRVPNKLMLRENIVVHLEKIGKR